MGRSLAGDIRRAITIGRVLGTVKWEKLKWAAEIGHTARVAWTFSPIRGEPWYTIR